MDANTALIDAHLAQFEEHECPYCDEPDCDCAEDAANDKADHEMMRRSEDE